MMGKPSSSSSSSSSKQDQICRVGVSMENQNPKIDKIKQEPRLSGAYIRTLVKHLTTSIKSKDSLNGDHENLPESVHSNGGCFNDRNNMQQESPPPPPPHKKQVRRRQHTTKPYQERLLNMAEARREIVTALKFHRASMKQRQTAAAAGNHRQPEQSPKVYPTSPPSVPYFWPISITTPPPLPPLMSDINLDFTLPNQTLGLNLNLQDFKNLDTNLYLNYATSSSASSSSSPSTSSSVAVSRATEETTTGMTREVVGATMSSSPVAISVATEEMMETGMLEEVVATSSTTTSSGGGGGLHPVIDDEGMEEIRSLGEQHQMEWNDKVNLLTSARWFKFLKTFEIEEDGEFNQVMEFPSCMDIGEMEGMDGGMACLKQD